ncbi:MAG: VTT domain-containing protein [Thermoflexales bacterium]
MNDTDAVAVAIVSPADPPAPASNRLARARQIGLLVLVVGVSAGVLVLTAHYRDELAQLGQAGLLGLFVVSILGNATVIIPAPAFVMACAGGTLFGPIQSGLVSGLGAGLGELTGYMAGVGGKAIIPPGKWTNRLEGFIRNNGFVTIFALAAIPNPLFDIGGMLAGITRMPVWKFILATIIGKSLRFMLLGMGCAGLFSTLRP